MFNQILFRLITRLTFSRWARDYAEHHSPYEECCTARLGPLQLAANYCFVLDHRDASASLILPMFWGRLQLTYMVCLGTEQVRQPGFSTWWQKPLSKTAGALKDEAAVADDFPF
jgi:hypothetical protein